MNYLVEPPYGVWPRKDKRTPIGRMTFLVTFDPDDTPIDEVPSPESVRSEVQSNLESVWPSATITVVLCG